MPHCMPEIEMNDDFFHAESTVAKIIRIQTDLFRMPVGLLR